MAMYGSLSASLQIGVLQSSSPSVKTKKAPKGALVFEGHNDKVQKAPDIQSYSMSEIRLSNVLDDLRFETGATIS